MKATWLIIVLLGAAQMAAGHELRVDFSRTNGTLRPLHGINKGPLAPGGLVDLSAPLAELALPLVRLHDCHWPNPDGVDIHAVFPNPNADPEQAASYDFALTDEYMAATRRSGAQVVYRLGESIEHTSSKRFVHKAPARLSCNKTRTTSLATDFTRTS